MGTAVAQPATPSPAAGGPFVRHPERPDLVYLDGPIVAGAAAAFAALLAAAPEIRTLVLHSVGGSVGEARRVALLARAENLDTYVPPGAVCFSACPIVFAAGVARRADGELGVHALTSADPARAGNTAVYRDLAALFEGFGVGSGLLDLMADTPNETMHVLTPAELAQFGLVRDDGFAAATPVPALDPASRAFLAFVPIASAPVYTAAFGTVAWRVVDHGAGPAIEAEVTLPELGFRMLLLIERAGGGGAFSVTTIAAGGLPPVVEVGYVGTSPRDLADPQPLPAIGGPMAGGVPAFWLGWAPDQNDMVLARIAAAGALFAEIRFADGRSAMLVLPPGGAGRAAVDALLAEWRAAPAEVDIPPARFFSAATVYVPPYGTPLVGLPGYVSWTSDAPAHRATATAIVAGIGAVTLVFERTANGALIVSASPDAAAQAILAGPVLLRGIFVEAGGAVRPAAAEQRPVAVGMFVPSGDAPALLADMLASDAVVVQLATADGAIAAVVILDTGLRSAAVLTAALAPAAP